MQIPCTRGDNLVLEVFLRKWAYCNRIRVHVELNVPLWGFSLTQKLSAKIESIQRTAVSIILGTKTQTDYYCNLAILSLEALEERRKLIIENFAKNIIKNPYHKNMFLQAPNTKTRSDMTVIVTNTKTARYENSSVPSLARLINETKQKKM